jgi:hypothetical protein
LIRQNNLKVLITNTESLVTKKEKSGEKNNGGFLTHCSSMNDWTIKESGNNSGIPKRLTDNTMFGLVMQFLSFGLTW